MIKIGIVTIIDNNNYGNRLQNYALQETLKKMDFEVETLINNKYFNSKVSVKKQIVYTIRAMKKYVQSKLFVSNKRKSNFKAFNKNISFGKRRISAYSNNLGNNYDYFVVGSDQVWKPTGLRLSDVTLLSFTSPEKRISYAASFGVGEISEKVGFERKAEFESFKSISVRENEGKRILEKYTNREDVQVLIDPTLLLSSEEWDKVVKTPKGLENISKKYILNYFLGGLSEERRQEIERIAKENDCEIIDVLDKNSKYNKTGPSEFLFLEKNAFLICTDSFHSCVFSLIYDRPFVVFDREGTSINMSSRIDTLITKLNIKDRRYNGKITKENILHDYTESYRLLDKEKEKSIMYLKSNIC